MNVILIWSLFMVNKVGDTVILAVDTWKKGCGSCRQEELSGRPSESVITQNYPPGSRSSISSLTVRWAQTGNQLSATAFWMPCNVSIQSQKVLSSSWKEDLDGTRRVMWRSIHKVTFASGNSKGSHWFIWRKSRLSAGYSPWRFLDIRELLFWVKSRAVLIWLCKKLNIFKHTNSFASCSTLKRYWNEVNT